MKKRVFLISILIALVSVSSFGQRKAKDYYRSGLSYEDATMYDKAIELFTRAIILEPLTAEYYVARGQAYEKLLKYSESKADYEAALVYDPKNVIALTNLPIVIKHLDLNSGKNITVGKSSLSSGSILNVSPVGISRLSSGVFILDEQTHKDSEEPVIKSEFGAKRAPGYIGTYNQEIKGKYSFIRTPMDDLKSDKNYVSLLYHIFVKDIKSTSAINDFYNTDQDIFNDGNVYKARYINPFKNDEYEVQIDESNNIIFLKFTGGINKDLLWAFHPIMGPVPFIKDAINGRIYFNGQKDRYTVDKSITLSRSQGFVLSFDSTDNQTTIYAGDANAFSVLYLYQGIQRKKVMEQANDISFITNNLKNNLQERVNGSDYFYKDINIGSQRKNIRYYPTHDEKIYIYQAGGISSGDVNNPNYSYIKEVEEPIYEKRLKSLTGFDLFLYKYFSELLPLANNKFIFKKDNKYGILDMDDTRWKNNEFVIIDNIYTSIEKFNDNTLKGNLNGAIYYFNLDGEIINQ